MFSHIKKSIVEATMSYNLGFSKHFLLYTFSSDTSLVFLLYQKDELNNEWPISFKSVSARTKDQLPSRGEIGLCNIQGGKALQTLSVKKLFYYLCSTPSSQINSCSARDEWKKGKLDDRITGKWPWHQASSHNQWSWSLKISRRRIQWKRGRRSVHRMGARYWHVQHWETLPHLRHKILVCGCAPIPWAQHHALSLLYIVEEGTLTQRIVKLVGAWGTVQKEPQWNISQAFGGTWFRKGVTLSPWQTNQGTLRRKHYIA